MYNGGKSNKCNQWDFPSSLAGNLRRHLKMHSGEKAIQCNQCGFASSHASALKMHLKTHSGEKLNKCNQCNYASSRADHLRAPLETHSNQSQSVFCAAHSSCSQHVKHSALSTHCLLTWLPALVTMITNQSESNAWTSARHLSPLVWWSKCH